MGFTTDELKHATLFPNPEKAEKLVKSGAFTTPEKIKAVLGEFTFPEPGERRPYLYGCMVLSFDGKMGFSDNPEGTLISKQNRFDPRGAKTDFWILNVCRCYADAVIMLYRGRKAAVLAYAQEEEREADFLASIGVNVDYIPLYKEEPALQNEMNIIRGAQPGSIEGEGKVEKLILRDGTGLEEDAVFILRSSIAPDKIIGGLELDGNHVKVDRGMRTNIPGFFAAGDITGTPYQYVKSAGEGNVAALSAAGYIDALSRK